MRLEIRDLSANDLYDIGSEGAILGRERAKTDIQLRDESISKRHARIFLDDGMWLLEDLNSSNGTFIDEQRITSPVEISKGSTFALAQRKFEVVYIEGASSMPSPAGSGIDSMQPLPGMESEAFSPSYDQGADGGMEDDEAPEGGVGAVLAALPKAVAYYMINVPLLALNPIGTIRKGAEEMPVEPMGNLQLAAFAIPSGVASALVGAVFGTLASIFTGFSIAPLIGGLVGAAIGGAIAGVVGFFTHPILKFLVKLFKGESNTRSRTNFAVQSYTLSILTAVPTGIGVLITAIGFAIGFPLISILTHLLTLVVSLVGLFFMYRWVVAFELVGWMRKVVLVLGVLTVLGALANLGSAVMAQLNSPDVPNPTSGVVSDEGVGELSDEAKAAVEAAAAAGENADPEDVAAAAAAALAKARANNPDLAGKIVRSGDTDENGDTKAAPPASADDPPPSKAAPPPPARTAPPPPARMAPPPARTAPPPPARRAAVSAPVSNEHPLGETGFVRYLAKRKVVEAAIDDDPSLLERRDIRRPYERLWSKTYDIRGRYFKKGKRKDRWVREKILARQKGQEIYKATQKDLDAVYDAIFSK